MFAAGSLVAPSCCAVDSVFPTSPVAYRTPGSPLAYTTPATVTSPAQLAPVTMQRHQTAVVAAPYPVLETQVTRCEQAPTVVTAPQQTVTYQRQEVVQKPAPIIVQPAPAPAPPPQVEYRTEVHVSESGPVISTLEEEVNKLKIQLDMTENREATLRRQLEDTLTKIKINMQREGNLTDKEIELERLREQLFAMDMRLVTIEGQRGIAEQNAANLEAKLRIAEERIAQAQLIEQEIANLRAQLQDAARRLSQSESDWQTAQRTISSLETGIAELHERIRKERANFENERSQMHQHLQEIQRQLQSAEAQRDDALRQVEFFQMRLREAEEGWKLAEQRLNQMQASWEVERNQLRAQVAEAQQRLALAEAQRDELRKQASFWENRARELEEKLRAAELRIQQLLAQIASLEAEIANLRAQLSAKPTLQSQTHVKETYKVKSFDVAAKLAVMDGTDDGMYNGLPIEVEGEGLYRDLVAAGRRPNLQSSQGFSGQRPPSITGAFSSGGASGGFVTASVTASGIRSGSMSKGSETYIVPSMDVAATLSRMNPLDDGTYKGLPIEVKGLGLYRNLRGKR